MESMQSTSSLEQAVSDALSLETFKVGDLVKAGGRTGKVAFVGTTDFEKGPWIGVILEKPDGKNNGTVKGKSYFQCPDKYGLFSRPNNLVKLDSMSKSPTPSVRLNRRFGSPTPSYAGSIAPSIAASQVGSRKEHSPFAAEYGYDINNTVITNDGRTGKVKFLNILNDQVYAGILFNKPVGDTDGRFQGIKYFESYPKYSTFLPANQLKRMASTTTGLPPKTAPRETKASLLRKEKRADGVGTVVSSWRGSQESLDSGRSPRSPPPRSGLTKQPNPIRDNEYMAGLKKCIQEKEAHLMKLANELEERRCDSERLVQENRSLKLRVGELDAQLQTVVRERAELQSTIDSTEKRIEDLSFCFTESEVQREDLEMRLNEIRSCQLQPLIEVDEPPQEKENYQHNIFYSEVATQTDQPNLILKPVETFSHIGIQTDKPIHIQTSNLSSQTEQTELVEFGMQTEVYEHKMPLAKQGEEVKATCSSVSMQTDQSGKNLKSSEEFNDLEIQTDVPMQIQTNSLSSQTDKMQLVGFGMQTEVFELKPQLVGCSMQTDTDHDQPIAAIASSTQTDPLPIPEPISKKDASNQTRQQSQSTAEIQTEQPFKPQMVETTVQTEQIPVILNFIDMESQTLETSSKLAKDFAIQTESSSSSSPQRKSVSPSRGGSEILELNVMKLPLDADTTLGPLATSQNSSDANRKKFEEKCKENECLLQQNNFLNSIIADQQKKITQYQTQIEVNGKNRDPRVKNENMAAPGPAVKPKPKTTRRMFCDHCEIFDKHDTEDCPRLEALAQERDAHSAISPRQYSG